MAFKGTLPSQLWQLYNQKGGKYLMELDLFIALEIGDKINEVTRQASNKSSTGLSSLQANDASSVVARRNARRNARKKQEGLNDT
jgi:hypothetical protein|tara:strand:+ start:440 stop:694 length:255 start_codon:yes stop_codon:yes gene_type:complete